MFYAVQCIVMAGGRGTRFGSPTKFLRKVCGESIIERLLKQLESVCSHILVTLSKYTIAESKSLCNSYEVDCVELSGGGYVEDLTTSLSMCIKPPVLVLAADIVARNSIVIAKFVKRALAEHASVVTAVVNKGNGVEHAVGLSLFKALGGGDWTNIALPPNLIMDVDDVKDIEHAKRVCASDT